MEFKGFDSIIFQEMLIGSAIWCYVCVCWLIHVYLECFARFGLPCLVISFIFVGWVFLHPFGFLCNFGRVVLFLNQSNWKGIRRRNHGCCVVKFLEICLKRLVGSDSWRLFHELFRGDFQRNLPDPEVYWCFGCLSF